MCLPSERSASHDLHRQGSDWLADLLLCVAAGLGGMDFCCADVLRRVSMSERNDKNDLITVIMIWGIANMVVTAVWGAFILHAIEKMHP